MEGTENLTYLQRMSLMGELAYIFSTSIHNAEMKFRIFTLFKEVEKEFKEFALQATKELTNLNEEEINRLYLEASQNEVPVWLWIEKNIEDMKGSLLLGEAGSSYLKGDYNKKLCREKLIESAFVVFARSTLIEFPQAVKELCDKILETPELSFLATSCFYISNSCDEVYKFVEVPKEISLTLLEHSFDIKDILSFRLETQALKSLNKEEKPRSSKRRSSKKEKTAFEKRTASNPVISIESTFFTDENGQCIATEGTTTAWNPIEIESFSECINKKIVEAFSNLINESSTTKETKYIVKKSYNHIKGHDEFLKECETEEEANQFVKKLEKTFPELQKTCKFLVVKKENEKGKS